MKSNVLVTAFVSLLTVSMTLTAQQPAETPAPAKEKKKNYLQRKAEAILERQKKNLERRAEDLQAKGEKKIDDVQESTLKSVDEKTDKLSQSVDKATDSTKKPQAKPAAQ